MPHPNAKTQPKPEHELEITGLTYGPYGIGRVDGKALMIPHTAPGERVRARVVETRGRYAIAELLTVLDPSPRRQNPPCPYVGRCGGCSWQHLRYAAQLEAKQQSVEAALHRIGKLDDYDLRPIIPADDEYHYRRRIRLQVDGSKGLGFYGAGSHDLVEVESCAIAAGPLNRALEPLRRWLADCHSEIEDIELVNGDAAQELVAVARSAGPFMLYDETACQALVDSQSVAGLVVRSRTGRKVWGKPWITVTLKDDLSLKLDADVFTQVNPGGNRQMLAQLLTLGNFQSGDHVLELYCGAGNFTLPLAGRVERITAVEADRVALANGKLNAQNYRRENIEWLCAAVPEALTRLKRQRQTFARVILDPPRTGAKDIDADLAALGAETIAYISCDPATLARDLAALTKRGYNLGVVQPVDFFPHTFHVETLALLTRAKGAI